MSKVHRCRLAVPLLGTLAASLAGAQARPAAPSRPVNLVPAAAANALVDMVARAGVVFVGHVVSVTRNDEAAYVDIRFAVDEAVKGCSPKHPYLLREWAGLWSGGAPRYTPGERLLMLLTPRSRSGFSSPVDGAAGTVPIHPIAAQPLADSRGIAPPEDGTQAAGIADMSTDLRWIQSALPRVTAQSDLITVGPVRIAPEPDSPWSGPVAPLTSTTLNDEAHIESSQPTVSTVLILLRAAAGAQP